MLYIRDVGFQSPTLTTMASIWISSLYFREFRSEMGNKNLLAKFQGPVVAASVYRLRYGIHEMLFL